MRILKHICLFTLFLFISPTFADQLIIEPDAGRAPLLNAIQQTQSNIDLAMYGFTDEAFLRALITAKNNHKKINVLLEPHPYQADDENNKAIRQLRAANIDLQFPDKKFQLIHQKTFIFDNNTAIVMTFNLTNSSFTRERNFALIINNPDEVQEIQNVFNADFAQKNATTINNNLVWSPDNSREKIMKLIQSAHTNIEMYAQDISDYNVIGALAHAARQGISVKILLSANPNKMHSGKFRYLQKAGVVIQNSHSLYIHAKVMIIDHQRAMLGSINFTAPSLDKNRELSVMTIDPQVITPLENTFNHDWNTSQPLQPFTTKQRFYHERT